MPYKPNLSKPKAKTINPSLPEEPNPTNQNKLPMPDGLAPGDIIKSFTQQPPVNVIGMAEALGLRVWEMDLGPDVSGMIFLDPKNGGTSGYSIGINSADSYFRKRFTVAHEIAHFLLHRNRITNQLKDDKMYRSGIGNQLEYQANRLAADILMPRRLIRYLLEHGVSNPDEMAQRLQVSKPAMYTRLGLPKPVTA